MKQVGDIGLHTVSHTTTHHSTDEHFFIENSKCKEWILKYSGIDTIPLSRTPFLSFTNAYFETLQNISVPIDSSISHAPSNITHGRYYNYTIRFQNISSTP